MRVCLGIHLTKVIEDGHPLELLHLAMQAAQGHSRPQLLEGLIHELHLLACGQEDDDFGAQVGLDEGPQHIELLVKLTYHVSLHYAQPYLLSRLALAGLLCKFDQPELGPDSCCVVEL